MLMVPLTGGPCVVALHWTRTTLPSGPVATICAGRAFWVPVAPIAALNEQVDGSSVTDSLTPLTTLTTAAMVRPRTANGSSADYPRCRARSRGSRPARDSLRIAANSSTLDIRGVGGPPSRPAGAPTAPVALKLADIEST